MDAGAVATRDTDAEARAALSGMVMRLFDHWNIKAADQASLLGLAPTNRAALAGYRRGKPFGNNRDLLDRASYLLGIHKDLRILFPHNRELVYRWPTAANKRLGGLTPVEYIKREGLPGLAAIRNKLDYERGR